MTIPLLQACSLARVLVGVVGGGSGGDDDGGRLSHVRKAGRGALDPKSVEEMTAAGRRVGLKLNNALMAALEREKLSEENDLWSDVKDFGWLKSTQSPNWTVLPQDQRVEEVREG